MTTEWHRTWGGAHIVRLENWDLSWRYFLREFSLGPQAHYTWNDQWHYIEVSLRLGFVALSLSYSRFPTWEKQ